MSRLVQEVTALVLAALALQEDRDELCLFVNAADFHQLLAQEPKFVTIKKYPAGGEIYFMGVRLKMLGNKGSPQIYRRVL
jgi:hypothetical protein